MSTDRETTRIVRSWLDEGVTQLPDRVLDAVLDQVPATPQRRAGWPAWRSPAMNKILRFGLAAAALVAVVLIGSQLIGPPSGGTGGPGDEPTPTPEASVADPTPELTPSSSAWTGIPGGTFVVTGTDDPVQITVNIASSGWVPLPEFDALSKDDDGLDAPETVGAALLAWAWPAGTGFNVYGHPCQWSTTIPETPATTPDEIAADLAAQASRDATAPVDVTVGGYAGKAITLHVPMAFEVPNATREEEFADCDNDVFAFYGIEGEDEDARNAQGPGQVDELWILDVDGSIVILDAAYGPATPADLVEELRALAESATFEAP
jgi:hypothetical protein